MAYMLKTVTFIVTLERNHDILTLICELFVCLKKNFWVIITIFAKI